MTHRPPCRALERFYVLHVEHHQSVNSIAGFSDESQAFLGSVLFLGNRVSDPLYICCTLKYWKKAILSAITS